MQLLAQGFFDVASDCGVYGLYLLQRLCESAHSPQFMALLVQPAGQQALQDRVSGPVLVVECSQRESID